MLRHAGNEALLTELVPTIVDGKLTLALAHQERQARYDLADMATTARADGKGGYTLEGEKGVVLHGDSADKLIVTARVSGDRTDRSGIGLFLVDAKANGVTRRGYPTQDGMRAADVTLSAVRVGPKRVLAGPDKGLDGAGARRRRGDRRTRGRGGRRHGRRCTSSPSTTSRRASSSACRSARSRCCSTRRSTCSRRSSRRAAWPTTPP